MEPELYSHRQKQTSFNQTFERHAKQYIDISDQEDLHEHSEHENTVALPGRPEKRQRVGGKVSQRLRADDVRTTKRIDTPVTFDPEVASKSSKFRSIHTRESAATDEAHILGSGEAQQRENNKAYRTVDNEEAARIEARALSVLSVSPAFPKSAYLMHGHPDTVSERTALAELYSQLQAAEGEAADLPPVALDEFAIYRPAASSRPLELVTLNKLRDKGCDEWCFDGVLSYRDKRFRVQGVRFETLSIDGYGQLETADMTDQVYLQSRRHEQKGIWYQLKSPAPEYARFHKQFVWLASFTRHFADYLMSHQDVTLMHFRQNFSNWLHQRYHKDASFHAWQQECELRDFRDSVAMNVRYLWDECYNIDNDETGLLRHPIWGEVDPQSLQAISEQPNNQHRTVVTPYAKKCFENMYFADQLDTHEITDEATAAVLDKRKIDLKLTSRASGTTELARPPTRLCPFEPPTDVRPGDVIVVRAEEGSLWGTGPWYAYVQRTRHTVLDIIWLYTPSHTTMANVFYPYPNELFFSDHCECGKDAIDLGEVIGKIQVSWFPKDPHEEMGFFIRQKFRTVDGSDSYDFVDLKSSDYACQCGHSLTDFEHCISQYTIGDTVLVRERDHQSDDDRLEPAQILDFDHNRKRIQIRRLARMPITNFRSKPNELSLTNDLLYRSPTMIIRKCHVRLFDDVSILEGKIPTPYDRDGTGDFYYINANSRSQNELPLPKQGWDPLQELAKPKMTGMGIFCGGGTFDRGLEEGGAVEFRFAVDWASHALHSLRANVSHPGCKYFLGSVNDHLARAMKGDYGDCIASPGEVQLISAGSPCPGFSDMQNDKYSEQSRRNASMVASVVSYADLYSPEYLILENVTSMTKPMGANKDQHVFAQVIAALVGLGYQVSQHLIESWSYGSPQQRPRLFIIATAPGLEPLKSPPHSHGHPEHLPVRARSLGTAANGKKFACRRDDYTPFRCNTAAKSTKDLPNISDAQVGLCARFPDHVTAFSKSNHSSEARTRMAMIPKRPHGMGLVQAAAMGALRGEPLRFFENSSALRKAKTSKTYSRVLPEGLFPTILTAFSIGCHNAGRSIHWEQDRELTVREARRAQGYLDHEVLIGDARQRLKVVGNSVDRKSALVLGLALRDSWYGQWSNEVEPRAATAGKTAKVMKLDQDDPIPIDNSSHYARADTIMLEKPVAAVVPMSLDPDHCDGLSDGRAPDADYETAVILDPLDNIDIDNKSVKMALNLSQYDLQDSRTGGVASDVSRID